MAEDPGPGRHQTQHQDQRSGLKRAAAEDHRAPPVCRVGPVLGETTRGVPLLPPIDQWGALPLPLQRLSPHRCPAASGICSRGRRRTPRPPRRMRPGARGDRARETAGRDQCPARAYNAADAAAAWERRRRDLQDLAGIIDVLTDVERRADELNRRAAELVEDWLKGGRRGERGCWRRAAFMVVAAAQPVCVVPRLALQTSSQSRRISNLAIASTSGMARTALRSKFFASSGNSAYGTR